MAKIYLKENVYDAGRKRIEDIFDRFGHVCVSFSGGKDSGVLLGLVLDEAEKRGCLGDVAVFHIDYEAQYRMTTDFVTETFANLPEEVEKFWCCLPIGAQCVCRMDADYWIPWEKAKKNLWVRDMPDFPYVVNEDNAPFPFVTGEMDYDFQMRFGKWWNDTHGGDGVTLTGIRADESYTRYMRAKTDLRKHDGVKYLLDQINGTVHGFPLYDWTVEDVWIYYSMTERPYNRLYDLFYKAGLTVHEMRVASPFNDSATGDLRLYKAIDPDTWGKMVGRVNGVNMTALYGGTTTMGWRDIKKPAHFTWKEYCFFLLNTLPDDLRQHYMDKLKVSIKFWHDKGGALDDETIEAMEKAGVMFENVGKVSKVSDKDVCRFEDYPDDVDCRNFKQVPSYKRMCVCIMKNDFTCKYMGFTATKKEAERRKAVMEKYRNL